MANNRMYLFNRNTGAYLMLAKYYPSDGWSPFITKDSYDKKLSDLFLANHTDFKDGDEWEIRYEISENHPEL